MSRREEHHDQMDLSNKELIRCSDAKKHQQIEGVLQFQIQNKVQAKTALTSMQAALLAGDNSFSALMHAAPFASLSQLTNVLYLTGGKYRRNM